MNTNRVQPIEPTAFLSLIHEYKERHDLTEFHRKKREGRKDDSEFAAMLREISLRKKINKR